MKIALNDGADVNVHVIVPKGLSSKGASVTVNEAKIAIMLLGADCTHADQAGTWNSYNRCGDGVPNLQTSLIRWETVISAGNEMHESLQIRDIELQEAAAREAKLVDELASARREAVEMRDQKMQVCDSRTLRLRQRVKKG
eukprot:879584-Prorocentrum_minimum.AAC.1